MLNIKTGGEVGRGTAAQGVAGPQSVGGVQFFSFALLVFLVLYFPLTLFYFKFIFLTIF